MGNCCNLVYNSILENITLQKEVKEKKILQFLLTTTAVILRIFSNTLGNVYQKKLTTKSNPLIITFLTYLFLTIICIPFVFSKGYAQNTGASFWLYSFLMGALGALGNAFLVKSLKNGELSVIGPINSYKSLVGLILGILFLREIPNLYGLVGMALIIFGSYFILDTTKERFTLKLLKNKEIQYRFYSLLFCAAEAIVIKKVILISSAWDAFVSWCLFGAVFSALLMLFEKIKLSEELAVLKTRNATHILKLVVCMGIMQYTTNYVFANMNVGYALALFQLSSVLSIIFGYKIFREENIFPRLAGSLIMVAGAVIIILYN